MNNLPGASIQVKLTRVQNAAHYNVPVGAVVAVPFETYLLGVVPAEIGNAPLEACKAQAIAARTYALPYSRNATAISDASATAQAYRVERASDPAYSNAHRGVSDTAGLVLYCNGRPLKSCPFSKSNGGKEISNAERWGSAPLPYLPAQDDPWDLAATGGKKKGHGVGMSQEGAIYAADTLGKTCEEILAFYYPGCEIRPAKKEVANNNMTGIVSTANGGALNMRKYPGASSDRILKIPNGAEVDIIDKDLDMAGWYKIEYGGQTGYVMATYIKLDSEPAEETYTVGIRFETKAEAEAFKALLQQAKIY